MDAALNYLLNTNSLSNEPLVDQGTALGAQVSSILKKLPLIFLVDLCVGSYLFIALLILVGGLLPAFWYSSLLVSLLIRGLVLYAMRRNPEVLSTVRQRYLYVLLGSALSGLIWGSVWLYLPSSASSVEYGLVVLWQCGLIAGAATALSINARLFFSFAISPVALTLGFLLLQSDSQILVLASAFVCFVVFIVPLALYIGGDLNRGLLHEQQNLQLQATLLQEREILKAQQSELEIQKNREQQLITEVNLSDRKLQAAAEERLLLLESIEIGIFGVNSQGNITFANPAALKLLEYQDSDIIGESINRLVRRRGGDADIFIATRTALAASYEQGISSTDRQSEFISKSGKPLPVQFSSRPIYSKGKIIGAVISFSDISRQREMEALLVQTQKLEALGRITGGVAHDFNNLLTVMIGNLQFLRKQPELTDVMEDLIAKVMNAATSGSDLVSRLLGFSKEQRLQMDSHPLNSLLADIEGFLTRVLGEHIELDVQDCDTNCSVVTDKTQFQNAIFNLCVNARDAMPEGGKLTVTSRLMSAGWSLPTSKPGTRFVELKIEDNGIGMDKDVQAHIFDPFFTTKDSDKGSGLGLSTVYGFIKQSGGNITVNSELGKGTIFKLYLPASTEASRPEEIIASAEIHTKYQGTILVVEDDDEVRSVAAQILVGAGYEVITAKDGLTGLEQFFKHPEIDLVFTDIIMPGGMSGIEMAEQIHIMKPSAPILLVTGYTDLSIGNKIPSRENIACLPKPYDADELPRFVHSLIARVAS